MNSAPNKIMSISRTVHSTSQDNNLKLLHLSDLHFRDGFHDDPSKWATQIVDDLHYELKVTEISGIIISGDLTTKASETEFKYAREFLQIILRELNCSPDRLLIVPGNHDLNWDNTKSSYKPYRKNQIQINENDIHTFEDGNYIEIASNEDIIKKFESFSKFINDIKGMPYPLNFEQQLSNITLGSGRIVIYGLNSAWSIDHYHQNRSSVHPKALSNLLDIIRKHNRSICTCLILVMHHPISKQSNDSIANSDIIQQICKAGFNLILHGHVHKPNVSDFHLDHCVDGRRTSIVATGTFGAPTHEWYPGYPLQYSLLSIKNDKIVIDTRRREEIDGVWKPDARWTRGPGLDPMPRFEIPLMPFN